MTKDIDVGKKVEELEKLAKEATPGPWYSDAEFVFDRKGDDMVAEARGWGAGLDIDANAKYIAALSPDVCLVLCAELKKARESERKWALALQSLTPGGSEFVDDPERCVACVRRGNEAKMRVLRRLGEQKNAAEERARTLERERDEAIEQMARHESEMLCENQRINSLEIDRLKSIAETAEQLNRELAEGLERYGCHGTRCGSGCSIADSLANVSWNASRHKWRDCTCGLAALLTRVKGEKL